MTGCIHFITQNVLLHLVILWPWSLMLRSKMRNWSQIWSEVFINHSHRQTHTIAVIILSMPSLWSTTVNSGFPGECLHLQTPRHSTNSFIIIFDIIIHQSPSVFFLNMFHKRNFGDNWHRFYGLDALPVTQPTASKHWRKFKALTPTSGLALSFCFIHYWTLRLPSGIRAVSLCQRSDVSVLTLWWGWVINIGYYINNSTGR